MPQRYGRYGAKRPFGPAGMPCVQHCLAISGASRLATAQALGGLQISAPRPETSHLLLEASSQAGASGGRKAASLRRYSITCRTLSDFTVILPSLSTSSAPKDWKKAPILSTESVVWPSPRPNGTPALWQASAAFRNVSMFQLSALGASPGGYMATTSIPACCFIRSMREQGPLIWLPGVAGIAIHLPFTRAR